MQVWITRKKRESRIYLSEDTSDRPYIYTVVVTSVSNEELRCSVPSSGHIVRVLVVLLVSYASREPEIAQFYDAVFAEQQIFRFYVSVHKFVRM